jgi:beta-glucosidase
MSTSLPSWRRGTPARPAAEQFAEALFGDTNPGGKLPVTFYRSAEQLPPFEDYRMAGRTYRYFDGEVLYPFGFGLSYTRFTYQNLSVSPDRLYSPEVIRVSCEVQNTGEVPGDEVVQVYLRHQEAAVPVPRHSLVGFRRVHLEPGALEACDIYRYPPGSTPLSLMAASGLSIRVRYDLRRRWSAGFRRRLIG